MNFLIADTFTDSLARLTGDEQKAVKMTAFDLQIDPSNPGMKFHKLDKARDKNFWSVRVNRDVRLIVHRTDGSLLLCYVDHHDQAYHWAERRKLETHPQTGAAQLVTIRERVQEVIVPTYVNVETSVPVAAKKALFAHLVEEDLLGYGVPAEWLNDVRSVTEDSLFALTEHLPAEAVEALLELATGGVPRVTKATPETKNPFSHPDAQRRFRVMNNVEELQRALDFPWDKWAVFLHPDQRQWVEKDYAGPAKVAGSAGTGKTIVALHRAVHLARQNPSSRVLLTTFSETLANALQTKLQILLIGEPDLSERIEVSAINAVGLRLYKTHVGPTDFANSEVARQLLQEASEAVGGHKFSLQFLLTEWELIVDAWQLASWEDYRDVARLGRKTRLTEPQRVVLWSIFERVHNALKKQTVITQSSLFTTLAATFKDQKSPFEFIVVDEAQDISISHLKFFASLGADRPNALFFAGDIGQRIFQQQFSWKALGVDIRGRSRTLRVNYRTSHQIRIQADRLLGPQMTDVDGNREDRTDTVSVFDGPAPTIRAFSDESTECQAVGNWIIDQTKRGVLPHEVGLIVRSDAQLNRAVAAAKEAGVTFTILDEHVATTSGHLSICSMHLAKGLEFRAVAVMACDDEIIPLQERIETISDEADLQEVYNTERHLLYVACTRARDQLLVTCVKPASEFLDDLLS